MRAVDSEKFELGILDHGWSTSGSDTPEILKQTIDIAKRVEDLGYTRIWLAEHNTAGWAWSCPEIITGAVAAATKRIRVGTACVLLSYYHPFKVASQFKTLESLYPKRIDLGVGNGAIGGDEIIYFPDRDKHTREFRWEHYKNKVTDMMNYLNHSFPENHPHRKIQVLPVGLPNPDVWLHGTNEFNMALAGEMGANYCHGIFWRKSHDIVMSSLKAFKAFSDKQIAAGRPMKLALAVAGVCADTEEKAKQIEASNPYEFVAPTVVGTPEQCRDQFLRYNQMFGVTEFIFRDVCMDFNDRIRCYELLSEVLQTRNKKTA
jgi:luciferase family oxidoreductase group 1